MNAGILEKKNFKNSHQPQQTVGNVQQHRKPLGTSRDTLTLFGCHTGFQTTRGHKQMQQRDVLQRIGLLVADHQRDVAF